MENPASNFQNLDSQESIQDTKNKNVNSKIIEVNINDKNRKIIVEETKNKETPNGVERTANLLKQVNYHRNLEINDDSQLNGLEGDDLNEDMTMLEAENAELNRVLKRKREDPNDIHAKCMVSNQFSTNLKTRVKNMSIENKIELIKKFQKEKVLVRKCCDKILAKICIYVDKGLEEVRNLQEDNQIQCVD